MRATLTSALCPSRRELGSFRAVAAWTGGGSGHGRGCDRANRARNKSYPPPAAVPAYSGHPVAMAGLPAGLGGVPGGSTTSGQGIKRRLGWKRAGAAGTLGECGGTGSGSLVTMPGRSPRFALRHPGPRCAVHDRRRAAGRPCRQTCRIGFARSDETGFRRLLRPAPVIECRETSGRMVARLMGFGPVAFHPSGES